MSEFDQAQRQFGNDPMIVEPLVPLTKRQQDDLRLLNAALSSCHSIFGLEALARLVEDLKRAREARCDLGSYKDGS